MLMNHHLAQSISDVGFAEFRRQLSYKAAWYGGQVVVASRWEPTSKRCSACGWVDEELALADRTFVCRNPKRRCGLVIDRDLNAAINLAKLAGSSSESQNACGAESTGQGFAALVKLSPLKQEPSAGTFRVAILERPMVYSARASGSAAGMRRLNRDCRRGECPSG